MKKVATAFLLSIKEDNHTRGPSREGIASGIEAKRKTHSSPAGEKKKESCTNGRIGAISETKTLY